MGLSTLLNMLVLCYAGNNIDLVQLLTMPADFEPPQGPQSLETLTPGPASSPAKAAPVAAAEPAPSPGRGRGRGREGRGRGPRGRQQVPPPPAEAPTPVTATPCAAEAVPSVLDALEVLKTRAGVFKRCAEHMGESRVGRRGSASRAQSYTANVLGPHQRVLLLDGTGPGVHHNTLRPGRCAK